MTRARLVRVAVSPAAAVGCGLIGIAVSWACRTVTDIDFHVFYESALGWRNGTDLYPAIAGALPNLNPPQFIIALAPLAWMDERTAIVLWQVVNLASLLAASRIIWRELELPVSFTAVMTGVAAAGLNIGLVFGLEEGHPIGLFTLCLTAAWAADRQKRWTAAAILVGILASVKPFFACLLLMPLCRAQWKTIACAAATAMASLSAGIALGGTTAFMRWLETGRQVSWFHHPLNASIAGLAARAGVGWEIWALGTLGVVVVTALAIRRATDLDGEWLACGLVSLLASPLGWSYYVPLVAGPLAAIAVRRPMILVAAAGFVWPVPFAMALVPTGYWAKVTIISLTSWSLLALWCAAVNTLSRDRCQWLVPVSTLTPSLRDATPAHR